MGFRNFLDEADSPKKIKVKKEVLFDLPAKQFTKAIPLCRKINADIKKVCDLIEHDGYYVLQNVKTWNYDLIISPENLAKIPGAGEAIKNHDKSFMLGVSEVKIYEGSYISNKTSTVEITGDIINEVKKNTGNTKCMDAQLIYGLNCPAVTENIALSNTNDGKYGGYFNDDRTSLKIHGQKGTIDTTKVFVTWAQQHSSSPFTIWNANSVQWAEVSMRTMFPGAYNKSTINKKNVFVIK